MATLEGPAPQHGPAGKISHVVIPADRIHLRVEELGRRIVECYDGGELVILAVMTGALVFLADLIRRLPMPLRLSLISVNSYVGQSTRSNGIKSIGDVSPELRGRDVLIIDDILDTGRTLGALVEQVSRHAPRSVRTCVLLRKVRAGGSAIAADFVGFDIADEFVVGYGLDYDDLYRNLPDVCALARTSPEAGA